MPGRMIAYYRVSAAADSGLGPHWNRQAVAAVAHAKKRGCVLMARHVELEAGRKREGSRPSLHAAIAQAKRSKAILLFAYFGELWKSAEVTALLQQSGVEFECCDNPHLTRGSLSMLAVIAAGESRRASDRTKEALAAYKKRGGLLGARRPQCRNLTARARRKGALAAAVAHRRNADGFYRAIADWIASQRNNGMTLQAIANALNRRGTLTRRGKQWNATQIKRVLERVS